MRRFYTKGIIVICFVVSIFAQIGRFSRLSSRTHFRCGSTADYGRPFCAFNAFIVARPYSPPPPPSSIIHRISVVRMMAIQQKNSLERHYPCSMALGAGCWLKIVGKKKGRWDRKIGLCLLNSLFKFLGRLKYPGKGVTNAFWVMAASLSESSRRQGVVEILRH